MRQSLRPYPQYNNSGLVAAPLGNTWYDSLQVNVTQRFNHGLSFNFNYTYSKNLELTNSVDPFNRGLGKTLSSNDIPHVLRLTLQYQVPRFQGSGVPQVSSRSLLRPSDWASRN